MEPFPRCILLLLIITLGCTGGVLAQDIISSPPLGDSDRIAALEQHVQRLSNPAPLIAIGILISFLFGTVCGMWAQNTDRHTILWFLCGFVFSFAAVLWMLKINSDDHRSRRDRSRLRRQTKIRESVSRPGGASLPSRRMSPGT